MIAKKEIRKSVFFMKFHKSIENVIYAFKKSRK